MIKRLVKKVENIAILVVSFSLIVSCANNSQSTTTKDCTGIVQSSDSGDENQNDPEKAIFLVPVAFNGEGENEVLPEPDYNLHVLPKAAQYIEEGSKVFGQDYQQYPDYKPLTSPGNEKILVLRKLKNGATGQEYIPLFISYKAMFNIYGQNIHVGLISLEEAREFAKECEGIVLGPGELNKVIPNDR